MTERVRFVVSQTGQYGRARAAISSHCPEHTVEIVADSQRSGEGGLGASRIMA
ncbi:MULTISPECIES: hypothetical protein [unclassified Micromonospora]|uniref:hypothetical protein n=1 Tax=unclassified Micromonospora TaxID=2617518 RepID=UPI001C2325B2|nr:MULTISPECIES: hypothetical protein [unclassified Micromonospora]MBU8861709.1 hypothetical protein [Micromonospora sp. WMMB482]MDM4781282.1 hypothetical protein [Micromonospora sp. b486]